MRLESPDTSFAGAFDPDPIRVVLADDHAAMRRVLKRVLDAGDGIIVVAEAIDLETAARRVHGHLPDVLILDLHLRTG